MITIINYGSGNIKAIMNIYDSLKVDYEIADNKENLKNAKKIIFPGVGSFDYNMGKINKSGMRDVLDSLVLEKQVPILGICVGLQLMAEKSEEGELSGLGWIKGEVLMFDKSKIKYKPKVPHMGWNSINIKSSFDLFKGVDLQKGFYFIHSYYIKPNDDKDIMSTSFYGEEFVSAINKKNIFATQFHPEKSHSNGVNLLKNFAELKLC